MDAMEQLVFDSEISVAVMGRGGEFVIVRIDGGIDEAATEEAVRKGYAYCGCLGIKDGVPGAKCESNPDAIYTCLLASLAFARMVCERLKPPPKGDGVEWLTRLFVLPDTRTD